MFDRGVSCTIGSGSCDLLHARLYYVERYPAGKCVKIELARVWKCIEHVRNSNQITSTTMELKDDMTQLNNLLDLLVDSQKGYSDAAENATEPQLKGLLEGIGQNRTKLIAEVEQLRRKADPSVDARDGGTLKGDMHRAWMDIREALGSKDNTNMLNECERGEKYLVSHYDDMLDKDVNVETAGLAQRQRMQVQGNLDRITQLRKVFEMAE